MAIYKGPPKSRRDKLLEELREIQAIFDIEDPRDQFGIDFQGAEIRQDEIERELDWLSGKTMADFAEQNRMQVQVMTNLANQNLKLGETAARNGTISVVLAVISVLTACGAVALGILDWQGDSHWLKNQESMHSETLIVQERMHSEQMSAVVDFILQINELDIFSRTFAELLVEQSQEAIKDGDEKQIELIRSLLSKHSLGEMKGE